MLGRIELEQKRLASARDALDAIAGNPSSLTCDARTRLLLGVSTMNDELARLATRTHVSGVSRTRLERLTKLTLATSRVAREAFALANGVLARNEGLDHGCCAEAEQLIAELASVVDSKLSRPVIPADGESFHRGTDVIRRRVPDHGIWDLPVMAHEFGHVLSSHLMLYDPIDEQVLELGDLVVGGWPGFAAAQGEELFCDVFAIYVMGPSYAASLLVNRLDPTAPAATDARSTHPSDATRANVILAALSRTTRDEPADGRYRLTCDQLGSAWNGLKECANELAPLPPDEAKAVMDHVPGVIEFLDQRLRRMRYVWRASTLAPLMEAVRHGEAAREGLGHTIRDVLNATWALRLSASPRTPTTSQLEADARVLVGQLDRTTNGVR